MNFILNIKIDKTNDLAELLLISITTVSIENKFSFEEALIKIKNEYKKFTILLRSSSRRIIKFKGEDKGIKVSSRS